MASRNGKKKTAKTYTDPDALFGANNRMIQKYYTDKAQALVKGVNDRNARKVELVINSRTVIMVEPKKLKKLGKQYFIDKFNKF